MWAMICLLLRTALLRFGFLLRFCGRLGGLGGFRLGRGGKHFFLGLARHGGLRGSLGLAGYHLAAGGQEFLVEFLHPAGRVQHFLLAGVERMAGAADFYLYGRPGGAGLESVAADAAHFADGIFGMQVGFHVICP